MSYYFPTPDEFGRRSIFGDIQITTCAGDNMQFSIADIPARGVVTTHSHPNEQMGIVISGTLAFTIGGETKTMKPGEVYRIPGGVEHSVKAFEEPVRMLDVFYPIRDEYRATEKRTKS
jgi:quercetin dioxygenase-like cupin family protein